MSKFGDIADVIQRSVGGTFGEMAMELARATHPPGHPEILFAEWVNENYRDLPAACRALGVEPPENGPDLFKRLKAAVLPELEKRAGGGSGSAQKGES